MKSLFQFILVLLLLCRLSPAIADVPGVAPQSQFSVGGYLKYVANANLPQHDSNSLDHLLHQRLNLEYRPDSGLSLAAGMRNRLLYGDSLDVPAFSTLVTADPGYWDLSWNWIDNGTLLGNTSFDRLYLDWHPERWQLRLGRQRIAWGMTSLWNPNDLFNSYSMFDIDYPERPGSDALLLGRGIGFAGRAEIAFGFGDNTEATSLVGRMSWNRSATDFQILGGKNRIDLVIGGGLAGSVGGTGLRAELTHFEPTRDRWAGRDWQRSTVATIELDGSLSGRSNPTWKADLLYISHPEQPLAAGLYRNRPLTARSLSFSRWTGYAEFGIDLNPLSRQLFGASLYSDGSWYAIASNSISLADDWDLLLVWQHFDGSGGSLFGESPVDLLLGRVGWNF